MMEHYFKFRSLNNIRYFLDILVNNRLYAARYDELNDPMEGAYLIDANNENIIRLLKTKKDKTRVCSLSKDYRHTLLWAHYADGHKGCCIEVIPIQFDAVEPINYVESLLTVNNDTDGRKLLSYKSKLWQYEQEVRLFSKSSYCSVDIHQILFGHKVSDTEYRFYERLIHKMNPEIIVSKIQENEINTGYNIY